MQMHGGRQPYALKKIVPALMSAKAKDRWRISGAWQWRMTSHDGDLLVDQPLFCCCPCGHSAAPKKRRGPDPMGVAGKTSPSSGSGVRSPNSGREVLRVPPAPPPLGPRCTPRSAAGLRTTRALDLPEEPGRFLPRNSWPPGFLGVSPLFPSKKALPRGAEAPNCGRASGHVPSGGIRPAPGGMRPGGAAWGRRCGPHRLRSL